MPDQVKSPIHACDKYGFTVTDNIQVESSFVTQASQEYETERRLDPVRVSLSTLPPTLKSNYSTRFSIASVHHRPPNLRRGGRGALSDPALYQYNQSVSRPTATSPPTHAEKMFVPDWTIRIALRYPRFFKHGY
ncbi:hypothetical protein AB1N83_007774 [Pleurotus pulmonarius]